MILQTAFHSSFQRICALQSSLTTIQEETHSPHKLKRNLKGKKQNRCFRVFKFNVWKRWGLDALQSKHKPTSLLFILYGYGYVDSYLRSINEFLSISSSPLKMFHCKTYSIFADENTQVGSRQSEVRTPKSKVRRLLEVPSRPLKNLVPVG